MSGIAFVATTNCIPIRLRDLPTPDVEEFQSQLAEKLQAGLRVCAYFGETRPDGCPIITAVLANDEASRLEVARCSLREERLVSLAREFPQLHSFEREIAEQLQIDLEGHPRPGPIRFSPPLSNGCSAGAGRPVVGDIPFYRVAGNEIHEVAVGPVHAGVIEPGHFRFQCHGEEVFHLAISLGYQHRGIERAMIGGPDKRTIHYMETLAGDTTIGHAFAYCQSVDALRNVRCSARADALRGIMLELERLANHTGDLGALANDIAYLPTASFCGRLRGDFLNMTAMICGSRFGRGMLRPGGVGFDVDDALREVLVQKLDVTLTDVESAVNLLWDTPSVMARFEDTGGVSHDVAMQLGLVGPAARACGIRRDVRHDHSAGVFRFSHVPVSTWHSGDVFSRAYVRWLEIQHSARFILDHLKAFRGGDLRGAHAELIRECLIVTLVEGWRGEICHVAVTDEHGRFRRYKVVDPSFHNWMGLAMALRGQQISDFPLCNKSFNLSYCGHDL